MLCLLLQTDELPFPVGYIFFYKVRWGKKGFLGEGEKNTQLNRAVTQEWNLFVEGAVFPEIRQQVNRIGGGLLAMLSTTLIVMY